MVGDHDEGGAAPGAGTVDGIDHPGDATIAVGDGGRCHLGVWATLVARLVGQREREECEVGQRVAVAPFPQCDRLTRRPLVDAAHEGVRARRGDEVAGDIRKGRGVGQGRRTSTPEVGEGTRVGTAIAELEDRGGERVRASTVDRFVDRLDVGPEVDHRVEHLVHRQQVGGRLSVAVEPHVVQHPAVAGMDAGGRRRVVGEGRGRERREQAPAEGGPGRCE